MNKKSFSYNSCRSVSVVISRKQTAFYEMDGERCVRIGRMGGF